MKLSVIGILLGLICLTIAVKINYDMSIEYYTVEGKTRALFGLKYLERLYFGTIGLIGLIISLIAIKRKERKSIITIAVLTSIISILITYIDLWRWMI